MKQNHLLVLAITIMLSCTLRAADRPNVLWLTSEDNGPHLGCYGDSYSHTPNLDELVRLPEAIKAYPQYLRQAGYYCTNNSKGQYLDYMFQTPTTRVWKSLFDAKKLNEAQTQFWVEKPRDLLVEHSDLAHYDTFTAMLALNALLELPPSELMSVQDRIAALPEKRESMPPRMEQYVARLLQMLRS